MTHKTTIVPAEAVSWKVPPRFVATCSCGWQGKPHEQIRAAQLDAAEHGK